MGVTEEGISLSDENKNKAGLPDIKVMGLFFWRPNRFRSILDFDRGIILI